ncbi:MAG TPA: glycosyltransferase family 2 protein [Saprospiraceae bacterium]|nr:glycosyltransferase family 2 protein [Saprospiraceae bacterium]
MDKLIIQLKRIYHFLILKISRYFDNQYYLNHYPDVKISGINPVIHYLYFGGFEGRNPSEKFDSAYYLESNPDVDNKGWNPLIHYLLYGKKEKRMPLNISGITIHPIQPKKYIWNKIKNVLNNQMVSIIVPAYNSEETIAICLKSLIHQTYSNLEMIVIDDGSEDDTYHLIQKVASLDPRVHCIKLPTNAGTYVAINKVIRAANGKYIGLQGADDVSLSIRIEKQLSALKHFKVIFTICSFIRSNFDIKALDCDDDSLIQRVTKIEPGSNEVFGNATSKPVVCLGSNLFHRNIFKKYGLYWENRFASDTEFIERILYYEIHYEFPGPFKGVNGFIKEVKYIHKIFYLLDDVLYISPKKTQNNLTVKIPINGEERKKFKEEWRARLRNKVVFEYPKL